MGTLTNTWRHIRRSPYQAFAAISIMMLTFIVGGMFFLLSIGSTFVLSHFEQKPQIIVFFQDTKEEPDIIALKERLEGEERIAAVKYVSKEEALALYNEQFKNDPLLLEMVSADILPASIEVSATRIEYLNELAQSLKNESDVQEIVFPEDVVNLLVVWTTTIRTIGLGLVVFLGVVSLFTVITVISMKIALKKEEIEILSLVGASSGYIRSPFIWEGVFYGSIGAFIGFVMNILVLFAVAPTLATMFSGIPIFPIPMLFYVVFLAGMLIIGGILGMIASSIAIGRYLR